MPRSKKKPAANNPILDRNSNFLLENSDSSIADKIASIANPDRLFQLAETDTAIYKYILNSATLFKNLCNSLNLETLSKMINNNELFIHLASKHLITLGQLRPEIVKEILKNYPWAFDFLSGDDFVSLSENNLQTAQAILQFNKIRERLSKEHLITLYQRDKTKTLLLDIVSYVDLFKMINVVMLPPEDADYVYKNIPIHTLFNHVKEDKEIYQIILNNPSLLQRVDELSEKMIDDDLLVSLPPELLVRFGISYQNIGIKIIRFCLLPPFSSLTGGHLAELGKNNPTLAQAILKNKVACQRLNKENLLMLCEKNPMLFSEIIRYEALCELIFSKELPPEKKGLYAVLDGDTLFNLAEKYPPVLNDILSNFSLFKKMCHKPTLTNAIILNQDLRQQLSVDHLAILILLVPNGIDLLKKYDESFPTPTIEHFVSIGKNDPEMIVKILHTPNLREQLDKEKLFTLYQSVHNSLRGEVLLAILTYSDLFKLIDLSDLPSKDIQYVCDNIDLGALLIQAYKDSEIYERILKHMPLFEKLCSNPEIRKKIKNNNDLLDPLTKPHLEKLNVGLWDQIKSTASSYLMPSWLFKTKPNTAKRKLAPTEEIPSKKQRSENQIIQAGPSYLTAYNQKRSCPDNILKTPEITDSEQKKKRSQI